MMKFMRRFFRRLFSRCPTWWLGGYCLICEKLEDYSRTMIEEVKLFKVSYFPNIKGPIRQVDMYVVAKDKDDARNIITENDYKFFDQDLSILITDLELNGYQQV